MLNRLLSKYYKKSCITSILQQLHQHLPVRQNFTKPIFKMNEAFLRYTDGSEKFDFSFRFINEDLNVDRQFNLSRLKSENVENFLRRIDVNVNKILRNKQKKKMKKNPVAIPIETVDNVQLGNIALMKKNSIIGLDVPCAKILDDPSELSMIILGVEYNIKFNVPWIINMKLPKSLLAGFPVYLSEFESLFTDKQKSTFVWYRDDGTEKKNKIWKQIGEGYIYIPTNEDIGSRLKLKCSPCNDKIKGIETEIESTSVIEAGPGLCPFELRQSFTRTKLSGNNFRFTSYNILANTYADTDYSREVLFPYCPPYALAIDYRKLLIIKELIGYNSDIINLQEVDKKIYENDLVPTLSSLNYEGVYNTKGEMSEGLAIIYDKMRFELLDVMSAIISENIQSNKTFHDVWKKITNENTRNRFLDRNTSILIVTLRSIENPTEILVIGNTHLYFHPDADHIRLLQSFYALTSCQETAANIREKYPEHNVTIILGGDFNSTPVDGVYELMTNKYIPEDHKDWSSNVDQKIEKVSLTHNLSLASACGTPQYTNFTVDFADCLDYIFYETNKLTVTQVVPMPSKEELTLHSAIPSVVFPSDHIAICADFKWMCK